MRTIRDTLIIVIKELEYAIDNSNFRDNKKELYKILNIINCAKVLLNDLDRKDK